MALGARIDYKALRRINPVAARQAVLDYLAFCNHNIAETARAFGITRPVVYAIQRKQQAGDLRDSSRAPHRRPRQTAAAVEEQVIAAKRRTGLGPKRLSLYLAKYEHLQIPWPTVRHIVRRHRQRLVVPRLPAGRQGVDAPRLVPSSTGTRPSPSRSSRWT